MQAFTLVSPFYSAKDLNPWKSAAYNSVLSPAVLQIFS